MKDSQKGGAQLESNHVKNIQHSNIQVLKSIALEKNSN